MITVGWPRRAAIRLALWYRERGHVMALRVRLVQMGFPATDAVRLSAGDP